MSIRPGVMYRPFRSITFFAAEAGKYCQRRARYGRLKTAMSVTLSIRFLGSMT